MDVHTREQVRAYLGADAIEGLEGFLGKRDCQLRMDELAAEGDEGGVVR